MALVELLNSAAELEAHDPKKAESALRQAFEKFPEERSCLELARFLKRQGRFSEAQALLEEHPLWNESGNGHLLMGELHMNMGRLDEARASASKAIELDPTLDGAALMLAEVAAQSADLSAAADAYQLLVKRHPRERRWALIFAGYAIAAGRESEAEAILKNAEADERERVAVIAASGLQQAGRSEELKAYIRSIEFSKVSSARRLFDLGMVSQKAMLNANAERQYSAVVSARPDQAAGWFNLGTVLASRNKTENALRCFEKAAKCGLETAPVRAACTVPLIYDSEEEILQHRERTAAELKKYLDDPKPSADPASEFGAPCFSFAYQGHSNRELNRLAAEAVERSVEGLRWTADVRERPDGKIRVVFASAFWRNHTVTNITAGLVKHLDRKRFEVIGVGPSVPTDGPGKDVLGAFDRYVVASGPFQNAREIVARQEADVLYYPDIGMDSWSYLLGFSRLARAQLVGWGHADTTGLPEIDAMVSCEVFEPPDAEEFYTERLERLGRIPAWIPKFSENVEPTSEEGHVYLCPQNLFKFHPAFDRVILAILERDPEAVIECFEGPDREWRTALDLRWRRRLGEAHSRVRFLKRLEPEAFRAKLASAACVLDTPHFGGGYTLYLAFAMGAPAVVWQGRCMRECMGAAMATQMGLPELVAKSEEEYVEKALRLGTDAAHRNDLRARIAASSGELFEDTRAVREFENCIESCAQT